MNGKNIVVTGGAGFIGYHLVKKLKDLGNNVLSLDNMMNPCLAPDKEFVYGDVRYIKDIERFMPNTDVVFHLAAQISVDKSIANPQETIDINVTGTQNVLELCRKYGAQMVFASSSEIYGSSQAALMGEGHPLDAQSPYAASKVAGDRLCYSYFRTYRMDVRVLRNFNTAGVYQNGYGAVIAVFVEKALHNKPLEVFGEGTQERDYMWVEDAVSAYLCISDNGKPGIVMNAGSGEVVSVNEIAKKVLEFTGSSSKIKHISPRSGEVDRLCCDNSVARRLGWHPTYNIDYIIRSVINQRKKELEEKITEKEIHVDGRFYQWTPINEGPIL